MNTHALARAESQTSTVNTPIIGALVAAATVAIAATSIASAAPFETGPIQIKNVHIVSRASTDKSSVPISAQIAFANARSIPATEVVFAVEANGALLERYDDVGSFTTGVTIVHDFPYNDLSTSPRVAVVKAVFADGTVWYNPDIADEAPSTPFVGVEAH
jgi:hypothetical protein